MKTFSQIAALSEKELQKELEHCGHELLKIRMGIAAGSEGKTSKHKQMKKYIAKLKTALRQKHLGLFLPTL